MSDTDFTNAASRRVAFSWGKVVADHQIGRYGIIEYLERKMNSRELSGRTLFHVYIDGRDQSVSCFVAGRRVARGGVAGASV